MDKNIEKVKALAEHIGSALSVFMSDGGYTVTACDLVHKQAREVIKNQLFEMLLNGEVSFDTDASLDRSRDDILNQQEFDYREWDYNDKIEPGAKFMYVGGIDCTLENKEVYPISGNFFNSVSLMLPTHCEYYCSHEWFKKNFRPLA